MLYDPRKDIPHCYGEVSSTTQPHRILDQSITIAALYNGLEKYRPYMHLHSQQDLRDSDLEYQDETYLPPNDSMLLGQSNTMVGRPVHHEKSGIISMNTQLERLAPISKYTRATPNPEPPLAYPNQIVMNSLQQSQSETVLPSLHLTNTQQQLHTLSYPTTIPPMQVTSPVQYTNFVVYNTNPLSYDPQHYINLLVKEQYFWLLDQFNDFNIWQTIIPVVCIKESDNFLFSCLMNCSRDHNVSDAIDLRLLIDFQNFKYNQVKDIEIIQTSNLSLFETLLISVCLILLGMYLKIPHGKLTSLHKQILNHQSNLFDQLLSKLFIYFMHSGSSEKSLIISSCIQSITILKFFMNKYYDLAFIQKQFTQYADSVAPDEIDNSSFIKFNSYEINFLNTSYHNVDITSRFQNANFQSSNALLQNVNLATSSQGPGFENKLTQSKLTEAAKLKELLWYLIKLDYVINFPDDAAQFSTINSAEQVLDPQLQIVTPEQLFIQSHSYDPKRVSRAILQNFTFKLLNMNNGIIVQQSNLRIQLYLEMSKHSGPEDEMSRLQCMHYFGWTLRYVNIN